MTDEKVTDPASYLPAIEAAYQKPVPEWQQILRATPGYGEEGGRWSHADLVSLLRSDYGMTQEHADALVAHTLGADGAGPGPDADPDSGGS